VKSTPCAFCSSSLLAVSRPLIIGKRAKVSVGGHLAGEARNHSHAVSRDKVRALHIPSCPSRKLNARGCAAVEGNDMINQDESERKTFGRVRDTAASHHSSGPVIAPASAVDDADDHPPPTMSFSHVDPTTPPRTTPTTNPSSTDSPTTAAPSPATAAPTVRRSDYCSAAGRSSRPKHLPRGPPDNTACRIISDSANTTSLHYSNNAIAETTRSAVPPHCRLVRHIVYHYCMTCMATSMRSHRTHWR
jgi:hypothetical protein